MNATKVIASTLLFALLQTSNAQSLQSQGMHLSPSQQDECVKHVKKQDEKLYFTLADGSKYILNKTTDEKPRTIEFFDKDGDLSATASELTTPMRERISPDPDVSTKPDYVTLKKRLQSLMKKLFNPSAQQLHSQCCLQKCKEQPSCLPI